MESFNQNHAYMFMRLIVTVIDFLVITASYIFCFHWLNQIPYGDFQHTFPMEILVALGWISIGNMIGLYHQESIFQLKYLKRSLALNLILNLIFLLAFISFYSNEYLSTELVLTVFLSGAITIGIIRFILGMAYQYRRVLFTSSDYNVMIIGAGKPALALQNFFVENKFGKVHRFLDHETSVMDEEAVIQLAREKVTEIKDACLKKGVNEIYYTLPLSKGQDVIEEMAQFADNNYIQFKIANDFGLLSRYEASVSFYDQTPIITLRKDPLASMVNRTIKRSFDILFSLIIICTLLPVLYLIIGLAIKLDSRGPVLFRQKRSGRKNRMFTCYKFRTMYVQPPEEEQGAYRQASKEDPRVTPVGGFLRRTNLDEFPQFINVLLGQMSVVGPRPHPPKLNDMYIPLIKNYPFRYFITPGITGHAQVNGYRGETIDPKEMKMRVEYDAWYIQNWTFWLDLNIIFQTIFRMTKGDKNAY